MLPMMIERFVEECGDTLKNKRAFLHRALEAIETEYSFWMNQRNVTMCDHTAKEFTLNRYDAGMSTPRPESYLHDVQIADNVEDKDKLFRNIAATAESGWDFSGRWLDGWSSTIVVPQLAHPKTSDILPVDLNAVMFRNELFISRLYDQLDTTDSSKKYKELAEKRIDAINSVLWSSELNMWKDYNWKEGQLAIERPFYITDICPLWYGPYKNISIQQTESMLESNKKILYGYPGGIPISEKYTGQQWDFPNVWAPTQFLAVKLHLRLFKETGNQTYHDLAVAIAQKWITTTYCGYRHFGLIFEKYNAKVIGQPGGGGEYIVQEGFGWSNGVILWVLQQLGSHLTAPDHCPNLPITIKADGQEDEGITFDDFLTVFVWVMTLLLSSTFAIVSCSRSLRVNHGHQEEEYGNLV